MDGPTFDDLFGRAGETRAEAHGRVNLIGEHTDYNGGYVLPTVIPQRTRVELALRADRVVRAWSAGVSATPVEYAVGAEARRDSWIDYVQAITWVLRASGHDVPGADVRISSSVPLGSGLSSSAALEIALLRAWRSAAALDIPDVPMARLGQRAENEFVGAPCGIMDQMACTLAAEGTALFLDTRTLVFDAVLLPPHAELVVINSGVSHRIGGGDYATRRAESEEAAARLGFPQLRDVPVAGLDHRLAGLPDVLRRRARHVVTEDQRVLDAVAAMRGGDAETLGRLFYESHASMRDDYQVSVPEIDLLVELARRDPRVHGARLTGGGFGGSIVALVQAATAGAVAERIVRDYDAQAGQRATILVPATA
ncbi:MAG: galactokinase [Bacteroidales bacterium]